MYIWVDFFRSESDLVALTDSEFDIKKLFSNVYNHIKKASTIDCHSQSKSTHFHALFLTAFN